MANAEPWSEFNSSRIVIACGEKRHQLNVEYSYLVIFKEAPHEKEPTKSKE